MKLLQLSNGNSYAIVDDEDYERLSKFTWHVAGKCNTCICRHVQTGVYTNYTEVISLAQEIMHRTDVRFDHKNRDFKDNQKNNLREVTVAQNNQNRGKLHKGSSSKKYKGITYHQKRKEWRSSIGVNGRYIYSKGFKTEEEAANWYNQQAIIHHKEFAVLNVFEQLSSSEQITKN